MCSKHDFLAGISFEHDAVMRLLDQGRCDKLLVILSKEFCLQYGHLDNDPDGLSKFMIKFAQSLQIGD